MPDASNQLSGKLYTNASGRASYEIFHAETNFLPRFEAVLQVHFGYETAGARFEGLDEVFQHFLHPADGISLELGWDNWSGYYLQARAAEGDDAVTVIGAFMDGLLASG